MSDIVERLRRPVFDSEEWYSALGAAFKMRDAGHRDSCARDLMDSYVDEAATERTEAADEIERLRAQVARLTAEQDAISANIGGNEYLDPPDGGNVSLAEQVRRMRADILALREQIAALESREVCTVAHDNVGTCGYCQREQGVEAAERDLMDSAMLLRRVSRLLAKADPSALAPRNAMDWLTRRPWFKASPLRDDAAMEGGK